MIVFSLQQNLRIVVKPLPFPFSTYFTFFPGKGCHFFLLPLGQSVRLSSVHFSHQLIELNGVTRWVLQAPFSAHYAQVDLFRVSSLPLFFCLSSSSLSTFQGCSGWIESILPLSFSPSPHSQDALFSPPTGASFCLTRVAVFR